MSSSDRHQLADAYDAQREIVIDAYQRHGHGAEHGRELRILAGIARMLHNAERIAGLPIGATRRDDERHEQAA